MKIALLQMAAHGTDVDANLRKGEQFCRRAAAEGADIALFPEMWQIGYTLPAADDLAGRTAWMEHAIDAQSAFVQRFCQLAAELNMAIGVTYLERWPDLPRNTLALIDRHGTIVLTYAKVHTCEFDREASLTPGDGFHVVALDTAAGPVQVGAMICYDREFPESARVLMLQGAEIVLVPNACEIEINRLAQLRARAYENMLGIALANLADADCGGHSAAFDGIAFGQDGHSRDMCLLEAGSEEGVFLAHFDLDALRAYRAAEIWGDAFRKPHTYGALIENNPKPPFVRAKARR